jgi:hypothetical protein
MMVKWKPANAESILSPCHAINSRGHDQMMVVWRAVSIFGFGDCSISFQSFQR